MEKSETILSGSGTSLYRGATSVKMKSADFEEVWSQDIEVDRDSIAQFALESVKFAAEHKSGFNLFTSRNVQVESVQKDSLRKTQDSMRKTPPLLHLASTTAAINKALQDIAESEKTENEVPASIKHTSLSTRDAHKSRREVASAKPKVEGREIKQDHDLYALTYGMMLGIRVMLRRVEMELRIEKSKNVNLRQEHGALDDDHVIELFHDDYKHEVELEFPPEGSLVAMSKAGSQMRLVGLGDARNPSQSSHNPSTATALSAKSVTPPHKLPQAFKFKDYLPKPFRVIRGIAGIDESQYMRSVAGDFNFIEFIANSKSGQFFFYSHDGKYMIKTQSKEECKFLRKIMPQYVDHIFKNQNSMLVKFYGMHRVKMDFLSSSTTIHFIVMSSVFDTEKPIHVKYDLKGSTVGRITKEKDCQLGAVQKDLNLNSSGRKFKFSEEVCELFKATIESDSEFLAQLGIMDYSLLIGVHEAGNLMPTKRPSLMQTIQKAKVQENTSQSVFQSYYGGVRSVQDAGEIYFMGIIDILQVNLSARPLFTYCV